MVGHKLAAMRCRFGFHKYEDRNMKAFEGAKEESSKITPLRERAVKTFNATRYCNDSGRIDSRIIRDVVQVDSPSGEIVNQRTFGFKHDPEPIDADK